MKYAYVTVITNDKYVGGLKMLIKSLKKVNAKYPLYVVIPTQTNLKKLISQICENIIECERLEIDDVANQNKTPYWNETFFKLNIMNLVQFDKIVFLDSDMIVLKNIDELFERQHMSAAVGGKTAHPEWTDFNSGLMVIEPSKKSFRELINCIEPAIQKRILLNLGYGDQDVFHEWMPDWNKKSSLDLGERYNALYTYLDEMVDAGTIQSLKDVCVIHYIGKWKPWMSSVIYNIRVIHGHLKNNRRIDAMAILIYLKYMIF